MRQVVGCISHPETQEGAGWGGGSRPCAPLLGLAWRSTPGGPSGPQKRSRRWPKSVADTTSRSEPLSTCSREVPQCMIKQFGDMERTLRDDSFIIWESQEHYGPLPRGKKMNKDMPSSPTISEDAQTIKAFPVISCNSRQSRSSSCLPTPGICGNPSLLFYFLAGCVRCCQTLLSEDGWHFQSSDYLQNCGNLESQLNTIVVKQEKENISYFTMAMITCDSRLYKRLTNVSPCAHRLRASFLP